MSKIELAIIFLWGVVLGYVLKHPAAQPPIDMSKEEILYISNVLMWFVICYTPIILYVHKKYKSNKDE